MQKKKKKNTPVGPRPQYTRKEPTGPRIIAAKYNISCVKQDQYPEGDTIEIAFLGRSNVGKSSLINSLCNYRGLALVSGSPGKTKTINFFDIESKEDLNETEERRFNWFLVDLPGYGYAKTPMDVKNHWNELLGIYMQERDQLKGMVLMCDIRRGFTDLDVEMINWFSPLAKPIHVLLTKCDKLSKNAAKQMLFAVEKQLKMMTGEWGSVQLFSSTNRVGLEEATEVIAGWIEQHRIQAPSDTK